MDWRMPGYTHLQRAQPVYLSHHLLAYFWKFRRDLQRFNFCMTATDDLPLGAGALAGVNFDTSRMFVAQELGFGGISENSLDAVSNRDFVLDYLSAAATCADSPVAARRRDRALVDPGVRLLRGGRRVLVGLQPDAAEEEPRRGGAAAREGAAAGRAPGDSPRRAARPAAHLQQGPPGGQGAALRRDRHGRAVPARGARRCSQSIEFNRERMADAASDEFIAATDVADLLVRRGRAVPRGPRDRGRRGARGGRARQEALGADAGRADRARPAARRRSSTSCSTRARGSSRRSPTAARRWRASAISWPRRARCSARQRR